VVRGDELFPDELIRHGDDRSHWRDGDDGEQYRDFWRKYATSESFWYLSSLELVQTDFTPMEGRVRPCEIVTSLLTTVRIMASKVLRSPEAIRRFRSGWRIRGDVRRPGGTYPLCRRARDHPAEEARFDGSVGCGMTWMGRSARDASRRSERPGWETSAADWPLPACRRAKVPRPVVTDDRCSPSAGACWPGALGVPVSPYPLPCWDRHRPRERVIQGGTLPVWRRATDSVRYRQWSRTQPSLHVQRSDGDGNAHAWGGVE